MSVSGIGSSSSLLVASLTSMRSQLDELQRQLGTGSKSTNYAGLGLDRGLVVGLRNHLSAISSYADTTTNVNLRISLQQRSEEHTSELQSHSDLVCRLLLEKKKKKNKKNKHRNT